MSELSDALAEAVAAYRSVNRLIAKQDTVPVVPAGAMKPAESNAVKGILRKHSIAINDMGEYMVTPMIDVLLALQAFSGIDPPTVNLPDAPRAVEITASTSTTVTFGWTQDGTVTGWYAWVYEDGDNPPVAPSYSPTSTVLALTGLTAGTAYVLELASFNDDGVSARVPYPFQTSTGTARIVNTDATTKGAARTAALAAANGSRNATFTATDVAQLTVSAKQHLVIEDRSAGTPDRYVEEVVCTTDGLGINIPAGTMTTALATTRSTMVDPWISLRKPGSSSRRIAVPLNNGVLSGNIILGGDIAGSTALARPTLRLLMPPVSFDTQAAQSNVETLIADMTTANEFGRYPDTYTNADGGDRGGIYPYVNAGLRPGNPLLGGSWGQFSNGVLSTGPYLGITLRQQPWGWVGLANRSLGFQNTGLANLASNTRCQVRGLVAYELTIAGSYVLHASDSLSGAPINNSAWYMSSRNQVVQYPATGSLLHQGKDETANGGGMSLGAIGKLTGYGANSNDQYGNAAFVETSGQPSLYAGQRARDWLNWSWHFFGASIGARSVSDMVANSQGFLVSFEVRKILHDTGGVDDRASAPWCVLTGNDWYYGTGGYADEYMHSRFKMVPDDGSWMRCGVTDIIPSILRNNRPPVYAG